MTLYRSGGNNPYTHGGCGHPATEGMGVGPGSSPRLQLPVEVLGYCQVLGSPPLS